MVLRKRISFLGFIIGAIVDIVGTNMFSFPIMIYVLINYKLLHLPPAQMTIQLTQIFTNDLLIHSILIAGGVFFSILAGYIAALIAKHDELLNGALSSFLCISIGIYSIITGSYSGSIFLALILLFIDPLVGMLGGYLGLLQHSRRNKH